MENKYGPGSESNSPSQYFVPITWKMWLLNNRFVIKYSIKYLCFPNMNYICFLTLLISSLLRKSLL